MSSPSLLGLRRASDFFYDAGDGQLFLDLVEIWDNRVRFNEADMHVYANNQVWPQAHVGGIEESARGYIHFPDFHFYRLHVERVRYIAGFGQMGWIKGEAYRDAFAQA